MKYCEKCLAKNGNFDFFVMMLQTSRGPFRQRERVTIQRSYGAERVNGCTESLKTSFSWAKMRIS